MNGGLTWHPGGGGGGGGDHFHWKLYHIRVQKYEEKGMFFRGIGAKREKGVKIMKKGYLNRYDHNSKVCVIIRGYLNHYDHSSKCLIIRGKGRQLVKAKSAFMILIP